MWLYVPIGVAMGRGGDGESRAWVCGGKENDRNRCRQENMPANAAAPLWSTTPLLGPPKTCLPVFLMAQCSATRDTVAATPVYRDTIIYDLYSAPPQTGATGPFLRHFRGCSAILVRHCKNVRRETRHSVVRQE